MPFLINLVFISFYWRRRKHPMPDLDRLVLISTVVKLMDSRRTTLPGQAFHCASRPMNNRVIWTQSNSKRSVNVSVTEAKHSIFICYVACGSCRLQTWSQRWHDRDRTDRVI